MTAQRRVFDVDAPQPVMVAPRLLEYPAWQVRVNRRMTSAGCDPDSAQMMIPLPAGHSHVEVDFTRTPDRGEGAGLSIAAVAMLGGLLWAGRKRENEKRPEKPGVAERPGDSLMRTTYAALYGQTFAAGYERNVLTMKKTAMPRTPPRNNQSPGELQYLNKQARTRTGAMLTRAATGGRQAQAIAVPRNNQRRTRDTKHSSRQRQTGDQDRACHSENMRQRQCATPFDTSSASPDSILAPRFCTTFLY